MGEHVGRRPLVVAFLGLCAGLATAYHPTNAAFALLLVPCLKRPGLLLLAVSVGLGFLFRPDPQPLVRVTGGRYQGLATVIGVPTTGRSNMLATVQAGGKRYRLSLPLESDVNMGDRLWLRGDIVPLSPRSVPQRLEVALLRPDRPLRTVSKGLALWGWGMGLRRSFVQFVRAHADTAVIGLLDALCLNVTSDLSPAFFDSLRVTGTVHIVSASGLHVAFVSVVVAWALLSTPLPRSAQLCLLAAFLLLYAAAAGMSAPMLRSVVMVLVGSAAYLVRREPDGLSSLALSGLVNLAWQPEDVANLGFQLSYLTVGALLLFGSAKLVRRGETVASRILHATARLSWGSVVASLAAAPLLAYTFHQVSLVSVVSNLLVIPVLPVVVVGSLASWAASPLLLGVSVGFLKSVVEPLAAWIQAAVEQTGEWPMARVSVPPFSVYWVVSSYVLLALLWSDRRREPEDSTLW